MEEERGMEDTEIWLISFVILPDRKQTYGLKRETHTLRDMHILEKKQNSIDP